MKSLDGLSNLLARADGFIAESKLKYGFPAETLVPLSELSLKSIFNNESVEWAPKP